MPDIWERDDIDVLVYGVMPDGARFLDATKVVDALIKMEIIEVNEERS